MRCRGRGGAFGELCASKDNIWYWSDSCTQLVWHGHRRAGAYVSCPAFFDNNDTTVIQVYRPLAGRTQMVLCVQGGCGGDGEDRSPTPSPL